MCREQHGCKFLGFHTDAVKDLVFLGCGATSLGDWHPTFQDSMVISSLRIPEGFILKMKAPLDTHHPIVAAPHADRMETLAVYWLCVMHVYKAKEIVSSTFFKYTEYSRSIILTAVHLNRTQKTRIEFSTVLFDAVQNSL
jgi:hypothetical protein